MKKDTQAAASKASKSKSKISNSQSLRVLIVEDSEDDTLLIIRELKKGGYNPVQERVETAASMKKALKEKQWDIILCDYKLPKFNAPSAIALLKETNIDIPLIIVSGVIGEETAVECMRLGAQDYIMKNSLSRLCPTIARELKEAETRNRRKQAEDMLREGEEKYRNILENIEDGYYEVNLNGDFTFFNASMCRILGYPQEEMMGMNNRRFTDKENAKKLFKTFNEVYRTGKPAKEFDWQIIRKDGTKRYIEVSVSLQKNSSGKPIGFRGISRDITERKQVEEELKKREEMLRLITENMSDMIRVVDLQGVNLYSSPSHFKGLGYSMEERVGKSTFDIVHPDDRERLINLFSEGLASIQDGLASSNQKIGIEYRVKHADGHYVWLETVGDILRDAQGKPTAIVQSSRDISVRKQMEEELIKDEAKYRAIIENMQEGYFENDLAGNFTFVNDALCRFLGYTEEELIGKNNRQYTDEKTAKEIYQIYNKIYRTGEPAIGIEEVYIRKNGTKGVAELSVSLISDAEGKPIRFRGISHDITERKQAESHREAALEALRKSEAQYRLLADHIKDQVWLMDLNLKPTYISPSVEKSRGYTFEEIAELPLDKQLTATSLQAAMEFFSIEMPKALADPTYYLTRLLELEFCCKDGSTYWMETAFTLIRDENGKPFSLLGAGRDITERKQAEESLRKSEENFRRSLDDSSLGVRIVTVEGETLYANQATLEIFGNDNIEELKRTPIKAHYTPESYADFQIRNEKRRQGEFGPSEYEISIMRKNGEIRHIQVFRKEVIWNGTRQFQIIYHDISERKRAEEEHKQNFERMRKALRATVQSISMTVEMKDPYTSGHQQRVSDLARSMATEMGLSTDRQDFIRIASSIHDIGKIAIPSEILSKPTKLTDLEFNLIKTHPQSGYDILKDIEFPWPVADVVLQHHERMDGSGYPQGLKKDDILLEARILAVADVVEAIASHRPYRPALGIDLALKEISENKGILYDADAVDACLKLFQEKGYTLVIKKS